MPADISDALARRLEVSRERVLPISELLDTGLGPAFIAHYRKAVAAGLDEAALRRLASVRQELLFLEDLRAKARRQAEQAGALSEDLARTIAAAAEPEEIEDLVRPYKPRRRTAALVAQERGLGPLADYAWSGPADGPDLPLKAAEFVSAAKEVRSTEEALAGASHILAERVAEDPRLRKAVRALIYDKGILKSAAGQGRRQGRRRVPRLLPVPGGRQPPAAAPRPGRQPRRAEQGPQGRHRGAAGGPEGKDLPDRHSAGAPVCRVPGGGGGRRLVAPGPAGRGPRGPPPTHRSGPRTTPSRSSSRTCAVC